jgi:hypothetical protein
MIGPLSPNTLSGSETPQRELLVWPSMQLPQFQGADSYFTASTSKVCETAVLRPHAPISNSIAPPQTVVRIRIRTNHSGHCFSRHFFHRSSRTLPRPPYSCPLPSFPHPPPPCACDRPSRASHASARSPSQPPAHAPALAPAPPAARECTHASLQAPSDPTDSLFFRCGHRKQGSELIIFFSLQSHPLI